MSRYVAALAVAVFAVVFSIGTRTPAQAPACLHGPSENADNRGRRQAALEYARKVNLLEAEGKLQAQSYFNLDTLPMLPPLPRGFKAQLSNDGVSYTFSLKDALDPCGFAYFSDQDGIVYSAAPVK
jgi:hypothetical protein